MPARRASSYFMYGKPKTAKRLYFDVIPKSVDEYHQQLRAFDGQDAAARLANPVWHIHRGQPPASDMVVSFAMLLNLASAANAHDKAVLWGFIRKYAPEASPETHPQLDAAAGYAVRYFEDFVRPAKRYRPADAARGGGARRPARPAARRGTGRRSRRRCRTWCSRSATSTASSRSGPGSRRSTRCCSGRRRGRASAASSRSTAFPETIALIDAGLAGRLVARRVRRVGTEARLPGAAAPAGARGLRRRVRGLPRQGRARRERDAAGAAGARGAAGGLDLDAYAGVIVGGGPGLRQRRARRRSRRSRSGSRTR